MAMQNFEKSKFRFSETFNNSNTGKSSGSGFIGVIVGLTSVLGFISGIIGFFFGLNGMEIVLDYSTQLLLYSTLLLGARKVVGSFMKGEKTIEGENQ